MAQIYSEHKMNDLTVYIVVSGKIKDCCTLIDVSRGGGGSGGPDPPFPGPPFFICDPC